MTDDQLKSLEWKECFVNLRGTLRRANMSWALSSPGRFDLLNAHELACLEPLPPPEQPGLAERCKGLAAEWDSIADTYPHLPNSVGYRQCANALREMLDGKPPYNPFGSIAEEMTPL